MLNRNETITYRKDGRYMGRFIIDHKENGKPVYQYVYGKTYEEAEDKLRIAREIESRYISGRCIKLQAVYEEWMKGVSNRVKESTYANYRMKFEKHILPAFGETSCTEITSGKLNTFIKEKLDSGLSASYVRDMMTVFKTLLQYVQEEYHVHISLKNVVLPKVERKSSHKMSDEQQARLVAYIKEHLNLTALGVLLSLFMGLRIGEVCGLQWGDIDLEKKVLHINRTVQRISMLNGDKKTKIIISEPKSNTSKRTIAIPDFLIPYLRQFQDSAEYYVLSGSCKVIEPRTMQYRYKKILEQAEFPATNYHQLRHTFATNCMENGFDAKTISMALGHSGVTLTLEWYVHPNIQYERRMIQSLSARF